MSDEALLKRFDLVADFPENISLIRRYIVDLAIRGRLGVPSSDQPSAEEMLQRIAQRATELVINGRIKKQKPLPPIEPDELPLAYADHCTFERLGNVATLSKGLTGIQAAQPGPFPLVVTAADRASCDHYDFDGAATIIPMVSSTGHGNASLNRLHYQEGKFALGTILCAVFPIDEALISARFLFEYLAAFKEALLVARMIGTANVTLTVAKIAEVPIPILPPAVQHRVGELMTLCDHLDAAVQERDRRRDRLAAASLQRLSQSAETGRPEASREHISFYLRHLPKLTASKKHIKALRQTVLNLAVRGRLVSQEPNDELIEATLLRNDAARKEVAASDRRADSAQQVMLEQELCWDIPSSWVWRGLADLALFIDYRGRTPTKMDKGVRLITAKNVKPGVINLFPEEFLSEEEYASWMTRGLPREGDVLFTTEAPMGNAAVVSITEKFALAQRVINFQLYGAVDPQFLVLQLLSQPFFNILNKAATGLTVKGIKAAKLKRLPIAIPPLAEQRRIVARVHKLVALCDELEAQLTVAQTESRRMLENMLDKALGVSRVSTEATPYCPPSHSPISDYQKEKASHSMASNPATTVEQLIACINDLGGSATPEHLLKYSGLSEDLETFYDLLRAARDSGALVAPLGSGEAIQRPSNAH